MKILLLSKEKYATSPNPPLLQYLRERGHDVAITTVLSDGVLSHYDLGVAYYFPKLVTRRQLQEPGIGVINIHQAYLPYGRGAYPNAFSILFDFPAGVTIHWMSEKFDEGPILFRSPVPTYITDTAFSLYQRLEQATFNSFELFWPVFERAAEKGVILSGERQPQGSYPTFRTRDLDENLNLSDVLEPDLLLKTLNLLRAGTFPGYDAAHFYHPVTGEKYFVEVKIKKATT